uniref:Uncharacterized protein n=1 Tax=Eutreptiella gymnastica TaxID=73025 RepID=A0A7S1IPZ8_9EUGL
MLADSKLPNEVVEIVSQEDGIVEWCSVCQGSVASRSDGAYSEWSFMDNTGDDVSSVSTCTPVGVIEMCSQSTNDPTRAVCYLCYVNAEHEYQPQRQDEEEYESYFVSEDICGRDESSIKIRWDHKGPWNLGYDRKSWNRWRTDTTTLLNEQRRVKVAWWPSLKDPKLHVSCDETIVRSNPDEGFHNRFLEAFDRVARPKIMSDLAAYNIYVDRINYLNETVTTRFFECYRDEMSIRGLHPRVLFHGTKNEHLDSIYERGLLTQQTLRPGVKWYTDAIWTATAAQISVHYTNGVGKGGKIFACAVLDENVSCEQVEDAKVLGANTKTSVPRSKKTSHLDTSVVLVRDECRICPILEITVHGDKGTAPMGKPTRANLWQRTNPNTKDADHALNTLSMAASHLKAYKPDLRTVWRLHRRQTDIRRRQQRLVKAQRTWP